MAAELVSLSAPPAAAVSADVVATVRIAYDEDSGEWLGVEAAPAAAPAVPDVVFDMICGAIDKADSLSMEGDYMLDSNDCISVVRVMQALLASAPKPTGSAQ
jgi:hypothetical protein